MIKWLLKKSIWATEARKWHGMNHNNEWCPPHLLQQLQHLIGPTPIFWAFLYYFLELLGGSWFPQGGTKSQKIKILYCFIVPWGTQRELVNTPWTHHVLHLLLVEWGTLFMGDLVHFGTLRLYWSMYCMLRSSKPLIRTFYLLIFTTRFESG